MWTYNPHLQADFQRIVSLTTASAATVILGNGAQPISSVFPTTAAVPKTAQSWAHPAVTATLGSRAILRARTARVQQHVLSTTLLSSEFLDSYKGEGLVDLAIVIQGDVI